MKGKRRGKKKKRSGILILYGELNFLRSGGGGGKEAKAIDLWVAFVLVEIKEERVQFEAAFCWVFFFFFFLFLKKEIL